MITEKDLEIGLIVLPVPAGGQYSLDCEVDCEIRLVLSDGRLVRMRRLIPGDTFTVIRGHGFPSLIPDGPEPIEPYYE